MPTGIVWRGSTLLTGCCVVWRDPRNTSNSSEISPETVKWDAFEDFDRGYSEAPCAVIQTELGPLMARNVFERALSFVESHIGALDAI